jgi:gag-polyprotein putative aspartyl protease
MLKFADGTVFAGGSAPYYLPEESLRLQIEIEINGQRFSAAVDTAAPYFICNLAVAQLLGLTTADHVGEVTLSTRKGRISGRLYRTAVVLLASEGESVEIEVTTFVPDDQSWNDEPLFLGLFNCLDRVRFAVDPAADTFYFGKP